MPKAELEKVDSIDEEIARLQNKRKEYMQRHREKERKEQAKRYNRRMALFESLVPDSKSLTEDQFRIFLENTVATPFAHGLLKSFTAQEAGTSDKSDEIEAVEYEEDGDADEDDS